MPRFGLEPHWLHPQRPTAGGTFQTDSCHLLSALKSVHCHGAGISWTEKAVARRKSVEGRDGWVRRTTTDNHGCAKLPPDEEEKEEENEEHEVMAMLLLAMVGMTTRMLMFSAYASDALDRDINPYLLAVPPVVRAWHQMVREISAHRANS